MGHAALNIHIGADSGEHLEKLVTAAVLDRWEMFLKRLKRCRKKGSERSVHDLRVATRRLIAAVDLLATVSANGRVRKTRQLLKRLLKLMGSLRDRQVQLLQVEKMLSD